MVHSKDLPSSGVCLKFKNEVQLEILLFKSSAVVPTRTVVTLLLFLYVFLRIILYNHKLLHGKFEESQ